MSHKILFQFTETKVNMKRKVHEMDENEIIFSAVETSLELQMSVQYPSVSYRIMPPLCLLHSLFLPQSTEINFELKIDNQ